MEYLHPISGQSLRQDAPAEIAQFDESDSLRVCNNLGKNILFRQNK